jgi:hypothetical protein
LFTNQPLPGRTAEGIGLHLILELGAVEERTIAPGY